MKGKITLLNTYIQIIYFFFLDIIFALIFYVCHVYEHCAKL